MFIEKKLAKSLNEIEDFKEHQKLKKFIIWIKKKLKSFYLGHIN